MRIGFIGIGQMGRHMARHILEAGYNLTVNDLNQEAARPILSQGAKWAGSPQEVAQTCEVVLTSLPTPQDVEKVVYSANGLKAGWKQGDIYIDMSTNSPTTIRRIAEDAKEMGVKVLDAPVSGGTIGADKGTLAIMVGGEPETLAGVRKILETMGPSIFLVGPVGCGNVAKLVNNYIALLTNSATVEGFLLGVKAGIDPQVLWNIVRVSTGNSWSLEQMPSTVFNNNFEPGFKLSLGRKDVGLALTLGEEIGVSLATGKTVQKSLDAAVAAGLAEKSVQAVILPLEAQAGTKVRTTK
jgi:2-hydroxymethylglutarate dehydrogenase